MRLVVYPGSFAPPTLGHLQVVETAREIAEQVVILVAENRAKPGVISAAQRASLMEKCVAELSGVKVEITEDLVAHRARELGAEAIVKGLRSCADWHSEWSQATANRALGGIQTLFIPTDPQLAHISSTMVRDIAAHGGDIQALVPASIVEDIRAIWQERKENE